MLSCAWACSVHPTAASQCGMCPVLNKHTPLLWQGTNQHPLERPDMVDRSEWVGLLAWGLTSPACPASDFSGWAMGLGSEGGGREMPCCCCAPSGAGMAALPEPWASCGRNRSQQQEHERMRATPPHPGACNSSSCPVFTGAPSTHQGLAGPRISRACTWRVLQAALQAARHRTQSGTRSAARRACRLIQAFNPKKMG